MMRWSVVQKDWFAIFKVKITARAYRSKYDCFCYILCDTGLFATRVCLIVQYRKLECLTKKLGYCVYDQDYSKGSTCQ